MLIYPREAFGALRKRSVVTDRNVGYVIITLERPSSRRSQNGGCLTNLLSSHDTTFVSLIYNNGHSNLHLLIQPWIVLHVPGVFLLVLEAGHEGGALRKCRFAVEHRVGIWYRRKKENHHRLLNDRPL